MSHVAVPAVPAFAHFESPIPTPKLYCSADSAPGCCVTAELASIIDFIRYAASRFSEAQLTYGHGHDNSIDEATHLVLSSVHLPPDTPPVYAAGKLVAGEQARILALIELRIAERIPVAYLVGEAWFAGLRFKSDERALVPRSPIAELIEQGFSPWLDGHAVERALDMCTGSGCIGIAMAQYNPHWQVDLVDISVDALALARENLVSHGLDPGRVELVQSDLFDSLGGRRYDLIVSNPPYVSEVEFAGLPAEYAHEPQLGLISGTDGLDLCLRMLDEAADFLSDDGILIVEVGASEQALLDLLPQLPFVWIEFRQGPMGVFTLRRQDLVENARDIKSALSGQR